MPYPTTAIPPPVLCGGSIAQCCAGFRCPHPSLSDTLWNGVAESIKMAELCDTFEVNCAAYGNFDIILDHFSRIWTLYTVYPPSYPTHTRHVTYCTCT